MKIWDSVYISIFLASQISLSFFNSHPSNRVSFSCLKSFRSSLSSARPRFKWSFTGGRMFRCQFFLLCVSILMRRWPVFFELTAGFDLALFRKNVVRSSPRPCCLGPKGSKQEHATTQPGMLSNHRNQSIIIFIIVEKSVIGELGESWARVEIHQV